MGSAGPKDVPSAATLALMWLLRSRRAKHESSINLAEDLDLVIYGVRN